MKCILKFWSDELDTLYVSFKACTAENCLKRKCEHIVLLASDQACNLKNYMKLEVGRVCWWQQNAFLTNGIALNCKQK
jgi:hypothetical protein